MWADQCFQSLRRAELLTLIPGFDCIDSLDDASRKLSHLWSLWNWCKTPPIWSNLFGLHEFTTGQIFQTQYSEKNTEGWRYVNFFAASKWTKPAGRRGSSIFTMQIVEGFELVFIGKRFGSLSITVEQKTDGFEQHKLEFNAYQHFSGSKRGENTRYKGRSIIGSIAAIPFPPESTDQMSVDASPWLICFWKWRHE